MWKRGCRQWLKIEKFIKITIKLIIDYSEVHIIMNYYYVCLSLNAIICNADCNACTLLCQQWNALVALPVTFHKAVYLHAIGCFWAPTACDSNLSPKPKLLSICEFGNQIVAEVPIRSLTYYPQRNDMINNNPLGLPTDSNKRHKIWGMQSPLNL